MNNYKDKIIKLIVKNPIELYRIINMIYRQTANPNATNSELDAKVIVKHSPKSDYEKFQEWLNDCPVEIVNYLDYSDRFEVTFMVNLEEEK